MSATLERENTGYKKTKNQKTLEAFVRSGLKRVEIVDYPQCNATSCRNSFFKTIKWLKYQGIRVAKRGEKVLLINDNIEEMKLTYYND